MTVRRTLNPHYRSPKLHTPLYCTSKNNIMLLADIVQTGKIIIQEKTLY